MIELSAPCGRGFAPEFVTLSPRPPPRDDRPARAALQAAGAGSWRVAQGRLHLDAAARRLLGETAARQSWARWLARRAPAEAQALQSALAAAGPLALALQGGTLLMRGRAHAGGAEGLLLALPPAPAADASVAAIAHELRTPLNAIAGFTRMAGAELAGTGAARHLVPIESAARLMRRVVDDLLDLAALDAGRLALQPEQPLDVAALVAGVGAAGAALRGDRPVALYAHADEACPRSLAGDAARLEQVLLNLLANALKFTDRGRVVLAVKTLRQDARGATLRFSVADTGSGIALDALERVGRPFERVRPEAAAGSGLGLAVVQRLLALHGSRLRIASVDGGGTICWFVLRLARCERPAPAAPPAEWAVHSDDRHFHASVATQWRARGLALAAEARRWVVDRNAADAAAFACARRALGDEVTEADAGPASPTLTQVADTCLAAAAPAAQPLAPGLRVLVVDDDPLNRRVLADFLHRAGVVAVTAGDAAAALARIEREHFDLALLDLQLGAGPGGLDLARAMRASPAGARLPFALLSAHVPAAERAAATQLGALGCLDKPFDPAALRALLHRARAPAGPLQALFAQAWPTQRDAIVQAADADTLRRHVHALRGSLAVLGDRAALALARQVEEGLEAGRPPAALPLASLLQRADALAAG